MSRCACASWFSSHHASITEQMEMVLGVSPSFRICSRTASARSGRGGEQAAYPFTRMLHMVTSARTPHARASSMIRWAVAMSGGLRDTLAFMTMETAAASTLTPSAWAFAVYMQRRCATAAPTSPDTQSALSSSECVRRSGRASADALALFMCCCTSACASAALPADASVESAALHSIVVHGSLRASSRPSNGVTSSASTKRIIAEYTRESATPASSAQATSRWASLTLPVSPYASTSVENVHASGQRPQTPISRSTASAPSGWRAVRYVLINTLAVTKVGLRPRPRMSSSISARAPAMLPDDAHSTFMRCVARTTCLWGAASSHLPNPAIRDVTSARDVRATHSGSRMPSRGSSIAA